MPLEIKQSEHTGVSCGGDIFQSTSLACGKVASARELDIRDMHVGPNEALLACQRSCISSAGTGSKPTGNSSTLGYRQLSAEHIHSVTGNFARHTLVALDLADIKVIWRPWR